MLIAALDKDVEDLVGTDRETVVTDHLAQNARNVEHRNETLIERARQRLAQYREGTLPAKVAAEWNPGLDHSAWLPHQQIEACPACAANGLLEGDEVSNTEVDWEQINEDDFDPIVTLTIDASYFSCITCQLVLNGYELIEQAGLPTTFDVAGDKDDAYTEPDYGND